MSSRRTSFCRELKRAASISTRVSPLMRRNGECDGDAKGGLTSTTPTARIRSVSALDGGIDETLDSGNCSSWPRTERLATLCE